MRVDGLVVRTPRLGGGGVILCGEKDCCKNSVLAIKDSFLRVSVYFFFNWMRADQAVTPICFIGLGVNFKIPYAHERGAFATM